MTRTQVTCPACGDRFMVPVHMLSDDLGRPIDEDEVAEICGCEVSR